ncbi:MAG: amino acid-binding ACT domain-containing protein [Streptosporangiales bacterium]|nr:amino acid-binding ACT domain-containing protein [Streptosporangiales bacterium]
MNLFTVQLPNQPGELARLCEALAADGVNLELGGVTTGERGTIVFAASDEPAASSALDAAGIPFDTRPAVLVRCPDQPGEGARFARQLANANVNIEALLEISISEGQVVLACLVDKIDEARSALGDQIVD